MIRPPDSATPLDQVVLLALLLLVLFSQPFLILWTAPGAPWYLPYLIWLGVILLGAGLASRGGRDGP